MRQVVNTGKGGPLLGQSSCMSVHSLEDEEEDSPKAIGPRQQVERERRLRREIANSNERRRMQSINHGYNMLKSMIPEKDGSEKLSKAAVLQQAAEYMSQLLEDRKQLLNQNTELSKQLSQTPSCNKRSHPAESQHTSNSSLKRQKRDTESSDEGISLSYQPSLSSTYLTASGSAESEQQQQMLEDLRREVTELRVQLEREKQHRGLLEQSYSYYSSLVQAAQQSVVAINGSTASGLPPSPPPSSSIQPNLLSPPQSRHGSTEGETLHPETTAIPEHLLCAKDSKQSPDISPVSSVTSAVATDQVAPAYGKASSVASQNLSIIVEAINHLENDKERHSTAPSEKDVDSGVSHCDYSDDTKSDCSRTETPQPPPAHQLSSSLPYQHSTLYSAVSATPVSNQHIPSAATGIPLLYRPTFLSRSTSVAAPQSPPQGVIVPRHASSSPPYSS